MSLPDHIPLSKLTEAITAVVDTAFGERSFWVVADVTDHKFYGTKGHHYFSLVEKEPASSALVAKVAAVCWRTGSEKIRDFERLTGQKFTTGISVLVNVTVDFHPVYGLKLTLQDISSSYTIGKLEQQRRETLELLLKNHPGLVRLVEGRFVTRNQELAMMAVIQRIAVITSLHSAGFEDFRHTLETNPFGYDFHVETFYAAVQGIENAGDLRRRFDEVAASQRPFDAVVLIRGGGAQTDFLVFDTYLMGETVAGFPVPVITGIGHQVNETITDLMAHTPLKTPTKAAEFIIARNRAFEEELLTFQKNVIIRTQQRFAKHFRALSELQSGMVNATRDIIGRHKDKLVAYHQTAVNRSREIIGQHNVRLMTLSGALTTLPRILIAERRKDLTNLQANLITSAGTFTSRQKGFLGHYQSVVRLMSPESILKKGFALLIHRGKIATDPGAIRPGEEITVVTSTTELITTVNEKKERHGEEFNL